MELSQTSGKKAKRWHLIGMVPLVAALAALCVLGARWRASLGVQQVVVEGCRVLNAQQVIALANIPQKARLYDLDLLAARWRVLDQPFVQQVEFHRQYPGTLRIRITERVPIASVNTGQLEYLDERGVLLPYVPSALKLDVPMISGVEGVSSARPGQVAGGEEVRTAIEVLRTAQAVDSSLFRFISEINMNGGRDIMLYSTDLGVPINLGRGEFPKKFLMLQSFWNSFVKTAQAEKLEYVDLRFEDQVVVRWQKDGTHQAAL